MKRAQLQYSKWGLLMRVSPTESQRVKAGVMTYFWSAADKSFGVGVRRGWTRGSGTKVALLFWALEARQWNAQPDSNH